MGILIKSKHNLPLMWIKKRSRLIMMVNIKNQLFKKHFMVLMVWFVLMYWIGLTTFLNVTYASIDRPKATETFSANDFSNTLIQLEKPARRIIALAPHIVENLYSAGAGQWIIGTVSYSDYPPEAKDIPRVGAISAFSIESILALKPDLVIAWPAGRSKSVIAKLESLGLTVYRSDLKKLQDIPKSIRDYGKLAGTSAIAERSATSFEHKLHSLQSHHPAGHDKIDVFYEVWHQPLQTLNGNHLISEIISLCGGHNIFSDQTAVAPTVGLESIILKDPDVIINSLESQEQDAWKKDWSRYGQLQAVANHHLYHISADYIQRNTIRVLTGAERLCHILSGVRKQKLLSQPKPQSQK